MQLAALPALLKTRALEGVGASVQLVNAAASKVEHALMPRALLNTTLPDADLFVLQGADTRRGAALVDRLLRRPTFQTVDYTAMRDSRPLLHSSSVEIASAGDVHQLEVRAATPGADWGASTGRSGNVAVYVDGQYHSDLMVMGERDVPYRVNLAGLGAGRHDVELRWSRDIAPDGALQPQIEAVAPSQLTGDEALIARYAPMVESRATRLRDGQLGQPPLSTDVPMLLAPTLERKADGGTRISYDLLLSNEDGGVPARHAFKHLGRTIDQELTYRVDLDAEGNLVKDMFQGPVHIPYRYKGERIGDRPLLTVATRNNLLTSRAERTAPVFSEVPIAATTTRRSDRELLLGNSWTTAVMAKELIHEGRITTAEARHPLLDPRRYLFLSPAARHVLAGKEGVTLLLKDGTSVPLGSKPMKRPLPFPWAPPLGTTVLLPKGLTGDLIAGVAELKGSGTPDFVLDEAYRARTLLG